MDIVTVEGISHDNMEDLKQINSIVLPVRYSDRNPMFQHILQSGERFSHVAYVRESADTKLMAVGAVGCRLESTPQDQSLDAASGRVDGNGDVTSVRLYVMTIAVLAMYRRMGIGRMLMQHVLDNCAQVNADPEAHGFRVEEVYLTMQVSNEEALQFYKSFGFEVREVLKNYYTRVQPRDAYLLARRLR